MVELGHGSRAATLFKQAAVGLALVALAACTTTSGENFSASSATQIHAGVTDRSTVVRYLGQPYRRDIAPNGDETWLYIYNETTFSPTATFFVPFIGPSLQGSGRGTALNRQLTISFHGDIVSSCRLFVSNNSATGVGLAGLAAVQAASGGGTGTTQTTNCGDAPAR